MLQYSFTLNDTVIRETITCCIDVLRVVNVGMEWFYGRNTAGQQAEQIWDSLSFSLLFSGFFFDANGRRGQQLANVMSHTLTFG